MKSILSWKTKSKTIFIENGFLLLQMGKNQKRRDYFSPCFDTVEKIREKIN